MALEGDGGEPTPDPTDALLRRRLECLRLRARLPEAVKHVALSPDDRLHIDFDERLDLTPALGGAPPAPSAAPWSGVVPPLSIAILVVGSRGDVQPFIPIARRLIADGHRVRLATHATFREFVESHGVEFFPLGGDPKELMAYMVMTGGKLIPTSLRDLVEEVPKKRRQMAEILAGSWAACTEPDPDRPGAAPFLADAIIANPPTYGHFHVAEALHVPLHVMFTMPWTPTSAVPHPFASAGHDGQPGMRNWLSYATFDLMAWLGIADLVNELRTERLGLDALGVTDHAAHLLSDSDVPHTYLWSPSLLAKPDDWSESVHIAGFIFLDEGDHYTPPPELAAFLAAGPPPVYVGFGSCPVPNPEAVTAAICNATATCGVRVVLAAGWADLGGGSLPPHVLRISECPHDWLFPRCQALCHHGGAGTVAAGLRAGLPAIIVPFFGDQHFWSRLLAEAGAGPPPLPIAEFDEARFCDALHVCLDPAVRARAAALGDAIRAQDGVGEAVMSFYRQLPLAAMHCALDPHHLARRYCDQCRLAFCASCDAAVHGRGTRHHHRHPYRYVDWAARRPELPVPHLDDIGDGAAGALRHLVPGLFRDSPGVAFVDDPAEPVEEKRPGPFRRVAAAIAARLRGDPPDVDANARRRARRRLAKLSVQPPS